MKKTNNTPSLESLKYTASVLSKQLREVNKLMLPLKQREWAVKYTGSHIDTPTNILVTKLAMKRMGNLLTADSRLLVINALDGLKEWPTAKQVCSLLWKVGLHAYTPRQGLWDGAMSELRVSKAA